MDRDDARELAANTKKQEKAAKAKEQEMQELAIIIGGIVFCLCF